MEEPEATLRPGDGGWFRTRLGEAVAIVLSILAAFAIDAGWDTWQERQDETEVLEALRVEYSANLAALDRTVFRLDRSTRLMAWGLAAGDEQLARLTDEEAAEVLFGLALPFTFDPNLGTTEALKSSGRLSLLRDAELQRLLMDFWTRYEDMAEDRGYLAEWANRVWEAEIPLGGPWITPESVQSLIPSLATVPSPASPTVDDLRRVRMDPVMPGLLRRFRINVEIYRSELAAQREVLVGILERLPGGDGPGPAMDETVPEGRAGNGDGDPSARQAVLLDPDHPAWSDAAPDSFDVRFETTAGPFTLRAYRAWAPVGVDRLWNLARHGFYDDARFHRVVPGFITQFGISGDPEVDAVWYDRGMPDDPVVASNIRGTVAYAFTDPGTRSTQLYVNMQDNVRLDAQGFAPVGRIVSGMQWAVDSIYGGYGEDAGGGVRRGDQAPLVEGGNAWIDEAYPELDRVLSVTVVPAGEG